MHLALVRGRIGDQGVRGGAGEFPWFIGATRLTGRGRTPRSRGGAMLKIVYRTFFPPLLSTVHVTNVNSFHPKLFEMSNTLHCKIIFLGFDSFL